MTKNEVLRFSPKSGSGPKQKKLTTVGVVKDPQRTFWIRLLWSILMMIAAIEGNSFFCAQDRIKH